MTKLLTDDGVEVEFEKQHTDHACKWCVYIRLKKKDKEQTLLMIRVNEKPFTRFTYNSGKMVILSEEILSEIFTNSVNVTHILDREIDKIENKVLELTKEIKGEIKIATHPFICSHINKGWFFNSIRSKWQRKYSRKITVSSDDRLHLLQYSVLKN